MTRIGLFIYVAYGSGGMFQYSQQVLEALLTLPKNQFKITVFHVDKAWSEIIPEGIEKHKVAFPPLVDNLLKVLFRLQFPDFVLRILFKLTPLRRIAVSNFDLVIFPSQDLAGIFLTKKSMNVIHDIMHRYEPQFKESSSLGRGKFRDKLFKSFGRNSKAVLVDSNVGKYQLMESYEVNENKIGVLPYIAPSHIVLYNDFVNVQYFNALNLPTKFVFYPAQFWPHKNHKILIEAAGLLKKDVDDFHLLFLGPKKHAFHDLYEMVKEKNLENTISFIDFVPNEVLGGFYLRARAMIMPTFYGPTNIPPLEAIALKCPVAVSRIYGMPDQLGDAALYFDNTDVRDVANTISQLWKDDALCSTLKENSEKHFLKWNHEEFNKRFEEIIRLHVSRS